jgi:FkbM family methyltransferase
MNQTKVAKFFKLNLERTFGVKISRIQPTFESDRLLLFSRVSPKLVIDGGANVGQWGKKLKIHDPLVNILSFEPLAEPFESLKVECSHWENWACMNYALSDKKKKTKMYIASNNSQSSSLNLATKHLDVHPDILFKEESQVRTMRLDDLQIKSDRIFLKLDLQGHEMNALKGATKTLKSVDLIEIEGTFSPLYNNETPHHFVIAWLIDRGFMPFTYGNIHKDIYRRIWQIDTLLVREHYLNDL